MKKRIDAICVALVAFAALVIPAMASGAPVLTESGSKLAVGAKVTATNSGIAIFEGEGLKGECTSFWTTSTLVTNDTTKGIMSTVENGGANGCTSNLGKMDLTFPGATNEGGKKHMCIQSGAVDTGSIVGRGCQEEGNGEMTINAKFTALGIDCPYRRAAAVFGSFTTNSAPATLQFTGSPEFEIEGIHTLCPSRVKLVQLAFNIYTDNAEETPLSIS
jgi:hypothetical protein